MGEAYRTANMLQLAAAQFLRMNAGLHEQGGCLVEDGALKELGSCRVLTQAVGCLQSSHQRAVGDKSLNIAYFAFDADTMLRAEVVEADGEWLYELDAMESTDPFRESNRALIALMSGDVALCAQMLETFNSEHTLGASGQFHSAIDARAWQIVQRFLEHAKSEAANLDGLGLGVVGALTQRCNLPWLLFLQ